MTKIPFEQLISHGKILTKINNGILELMTQSSITSIAYNLVGNSYKRHYLELPQKAHIPCSLTMQLKLDYQGLILLVGDGHILFNCPSSHPLEDPVKPTGKAFLDGHQFDNHLPLNQYVTVTITYGMREMQILVDGKEAFYSTKQPYMKAKELVQIKETGLRVGFEVAKLSTLMVKSIELTQLPQGEILSRPESYCSEVRKSSEKRAGMAPVKTCFENFITNFTEEIQKELVYTDSFLKSLKTIKIKRIVDPRGDKVTYMASDYGVSYSIRRAVDEWQQSFSFYVVTAGTGDTWHRRADYMEEILVEISKKDSALAERIFNSLNDCVACYGPGCIVKTLYNFQGKKKLVCHGIVMLRICREDFQDIRDFFMYFNIMMERKKQEGTLQTEKIYLMK